MEERGGREEKERKEEGEIGGKGQGTIPTPIPAYYAHSYDTI